MERAYKIRIYPNKTQEKLINKTFGCARFVYNYFLAKKIELYQNEEISLSYMDCSRRLTQLKKELLWLKEVDKCSLQNSLKNLDSSYKNFFREIKKGNMNQGFPKFKSKKTAKCSYKTNSNIKLYEKHIQLPKLGKVRFRDSYQIKGRILSATVSRSKSGKYFCSICCTDVKTTPPPKTGNKVGIDLGIKNFATLSNGTVVPNPRYMNKTLATIQKLHQGLSRKSRGGSNWNKQRIRLARAYEKLSNQRKDFLNKLTTNLIREYDVICIENLKVANLIKNHKLARHIQDASWYEFKRQLLYKALWYEKEIRIIDTYYPSSQTCHQCGMKNKDVKDLKIRTWTCPNCGQTFDRDMNAAMNILKEGIKTSAVGITV